MGVFLDRPSRGEADLPLLKSIKGAILASKPSNLVSLS
jgi:hypothetical protein